MSASKPRAHYPITNEFIFTCNQSLFLLPSQIRCNLFCSTVFTWPEGGVVNSNYSVHDNDDDNNGMVTHITRFARLAGSACGLKTYCHITLKSCEYWKDLLIGCKTVSKSLTLGCHGRKQRGRPQPRNSTHGWVRFPNRWVPTQPPPPSGQNFKTHEDDLGVSLRFLWWR